MTKKTAQVGETYELTGESKTNEWGVTVHRIRALVDFPKLGVRCGGAGGWVESILTPSGDARVSGGAWVSGGAQVFGDARVFGGSLV